VRPARPASGPAQQLAAIINQLASDDLTVVDGQQLADDTLAGTAEALAAGELTVEHAMVLACGTHDPPHATVLEAEPVLLAAATAWTRPGSARC
jgi:hypothetical protein